MITRQLGTSEIRASVLGLGGTNFQPRRLDERATREVIHAALDAGVTFIDTAIGYQSSEEFIGAALAGRRERAVIATKFNFVDLVGDPKVRITEHCNESLRRLRTDYIDLFQIHDPSDVISTRDLLVCLAELRQSGKIRAYGASNYASWRVAESYFTASELGISQFASVQNEYSLLHRQPERELIQSLERFGLALIPFHPLGEGMLTGKYKMGEAPPAGTRGAQGSRGLVKKLNTPISWAILRMLTEFAGDHGRTISELAIAWLTAKRYVGSVIASVSNVKQLEANIAGAEWQLSEEDCREIDRLSDTGENAPSEDYYASVTQALPSLLPVMVGAFRPPSRPETDRVGG